MFNLFEADLNCVTAFAHSSRSGSSKEKFNEHCERTIKYYQQFVSSFKIENIIKELISYIEREFDVEATYHRLQKIIYFHDVGKLTKKFQLKLDGENNNETHSDKSFYFLTYTFFKFHFNGEITEKEFFFYLIVLYSVLKHHGKLKDLTHEIRDLHFDEKREKICEIAEFLKLDLDKETIDRVISIYFDWEVVAHTASTVSDALEVWRRYQTSWWDALIVASAIKAKAQVIYSEDLQNGQVFEGIKVVNPFLSG